MANLIQAAVEPLRGEAILDARQFAQRLVKMVEDTLNEHGGDRQAAFPYPSSSMGRNDYMRAKSRYQLAHALTVSIKAGSRSMRDPDPAVMDQERIQRFYKQTQDEASAQFDSYVAKLTAKVGEVTAAQLHGDHVWSYSVLHVTTVAGDFQVWKTQRIVNFSKLGKVFNQYPTRQVKTGHIAA